MLPIPIKKFIELFSELPSIGPRQATRLAFHLIASGKNTIQEIERSLSDIKNLKNCEQCFFIATAPSNLCFFCADSKRRKDLIAIVEKPTDLLSLEKTRTFNGQYFILGDLAKAGVLETAQRLRIKNLASRMEKEFPDKNAEIIIAISPTTFGDFTAQLITQEFKPLVKKITRLGRGIPTGGEIEFADEETLRNALERRN
ncbi:MAG: recombination protein RecR [Candidatus Brennerbacteria bacterium]|nr:recombination protein RecR [Candidatus Brennerbacteria bacterium]